MSMLVPSLWTILAVSAALLLVCHRFVIDRLTPKPFGNVPHRRSIKDARQWPFFGDTIDLLSWIRKHNSHNDWFANVVRSLGYPPLCEVVMGFRPMDHLIIVSDVQEVEDILIRRTQEFDRSLATIEVFSPLAPTAQIALPTNAMWKHHRRIMGPTMTSASVKRFSPRASASIARLVELWKVEAPFGTFDPRQDIEVSSLEDSEWAIAEALYQFATMDVICAIVMGETLGCLDSAIKGAQKGPISTTGTTTYSSFDVQVPEMFPPLVYFLASVTIATPLRSIINAYRSLTPTYRRYFARIERWVAWKLSDARTARTARGTDAANMVDCVLDVVCLKEEDEDRLTESEMRDELLQYIAAGQDTTATALQWALKYLTENPTVQQKLHAAVVAQDLVDENPTWDDVLDMHYLDAVAWEILRLGAPAATTARQATEDVVVLGEVFPKGTTFLFVNSQLCKTNSERDVDSLRSATSKQHGRRVGWWDSPLVFNPDRWLDASGAFDSKAGPALPFGAGQRGCFGKTLAVLELKLFLFHLSRAFFFEPVPDELAGWAERKAIIRKPAQCYVKVSTWPET